MTNRNTKTFTLSAIKLIESASMREWASNAHNLPLITAASATYKGTRADFAAYLTMVAMG